jgi:hypothetical protein
MIIWLGDVRYESEELMVALKADVNLLTMTIAKLELAREMKHRAIRMVWLMAE